MDGKGKMDMEHRPESRIEAFHVTEEELNQRGWTVAGLTREQTLTLVREVCPGLVESVAVYYTEKGADLLVRWRAIRPMPQVLLCRGRVRRHLT